MREAPYAVIAIFTRSPIAKAAVERMGVVELGASPTDEVDAFVEDAPFE